MRHMHSVAEVKMVESGLKQMKNGVPKWQQTGSAKGQLICELEGINFLGTSKAVRFIKQFYFPSRKNIMAASVFSFLHLH